MQRERLTLTPEAVQEERNIEQQQEDGKRNIAACELRKQHGRAGDAAVVQTDGRKEEHDAERIDAAGDGEHQQ